MALMLSRRLLTVLILVFLGIALVVVSLKTRPAASAATAKGTSPAASATTAKGTSPAASVTASATAAPSGGDGYFAEYRMARDRALSMEESLLRNVVDDPRSTAEARQAAQDELLRLGRDQTRLVNLEGLVQAEGYTNAVVFLEKQGLTVVVGGHISASKAAGLVHVLARQAGVPTADVAIIQRP